MLEDNEALPFKDPIILFYNYDVFMRFKGTFDDPEPIFTRKIFKK